MAHERMKRTGVEGDIREELTKAIQQHGWFKSPHEAYGVLAEEVYEVLMALHSNDSKQMYKELSQVAAVAMKAMILLQ